MHSPYASCADFRKFCSLALLDSLIIRSRKSSMTRRATTATTRLIDNSRECRCTPCYTIMRTSRNVKNNTLEKNADLLGIIKQKERKFEIKIELRVHKSGAESQNMGRQLYFQSQCLKSRFNLQNEAFTNKIFCIY